jgi:hypothetical protein
MYDIAGYEKIPKDKIKQLMKNTLDRAVQASPNKSATGIERFYNEIGCNDSYINCFNQHWHLQPFAKAIKLTIEKSMRKTSLKECNFANFYISKKVYIDWKKRGIKYEKKQKEISAFTAKDKIQQTFIKIPNNYVVKHFKNIVKNKLNMSISEVVVIALDFFMKQHKDVFGEYRGKIDESVIQENKSSLVFAFCDKELVNKIWKTLQRINQVNMPPIKFGEFVETALAEKLERIPVQYTNPQLFEEYKQLVKENQKLEKELKETE